MAPRAVWVIWAINLLFEEKYLTRFCKEAGFFVENLLFRHSNLKFKISNFKFYEVKYCYF
jgi:hypothetical protein